MSGKTYIAEPESKREREYAEQAYLEYFNHYLYTQNLISEKEYKRMVEEIARRSARSRSKNSR